MRYAFPISTTSGWLFPVAIASFPIHLWNSPPEGSYTPAIVTNAAKKSTSLVEKMIVQPKKGKAATTRFTFDLDESMQKKLTALAEHPNGSKASVLKFLINEVYKELTD